MKSNLFIVCTLCFSFVLSSCKSPGEKLLENTIDILKPKSGKLNKGKSYTGLVGGYSWWTFDGTNLNLEYTAGAINVSRAIEKFDIEELEIKIYPWDKWDSWDNDDWKYEDSLRENNAFYKKFESLLNADGEMQINYQRTPRQFLMGQWGNATFGLEFKKVYKGERVSNELLESDSTKYAIMFRISWGGGARSNWERYLDYDDPRAKKLYDLFYDVDENEFLSEVKKMDDYYEELNKDSDGDGMSDEYEIYSGYDPNNPDTDGDGIIDGKDFLPLDTLYSARQRNQDKLEN